MALTPAGLEPAKPKILHPRLAELWLIRCQTSLKSLIYGANFRNYVRVTEFTEFRIQVRAPPAGESHRDPGSPPPAIPALPFPEHR